MTLSRREKIEALLADDPKDQFLRYSLALELETAGEHEASLTLLHGLAADSPPHVAAIFMAGQQLARLGRIDEARDIVSSGVVEAKRQGNAHAAGEMAEFLQGLENDQE
jgi:hypothetical protein